MNGVPVEARFRCLVAAMVISSITGCGDGYAAQAGSRAASMFRGDATHSGVYAASGWQALGGLKWRFMTDGDVISSPTVVGQTVYVGSGDGRLYALDRNTGARRWAFDARNPIPSSPAVGGGAVFEIGRASCRERV